MSDDVDRQFRRILPTLREVEREVKQSGLTGKDQAALLTMLTARLLGTTGATMAAVSAAAAGEPLDKSDENIVAWSKVVADHVVDLLRSGAAI